MNVNSNKTIILKKKKKYWGKESNISQVSPSRREFVKKAAIAGTILAVPSFGFNIIKNPKLDGEVIGHGDFTYKVERAWGNLDPAKTPVNNCHEMVMDSKGRLILATDHPKNNIIIYDQSGKLLDSWTLGLKGTHGLSIHDEGGEEFLYITDPGAGNRYPS